MMIKKIKKIKMIMMAAQIVMAMTEVIITMTVHDDLLCQRNDDHDDHDDCDDSNDGVDHDGDDFDHLSGDYSFYHEW